MQLRGVFETKMTAILFGYVFYRDAYSVFARQSGRYSCRSEEALGIDQLGQYVLVVNKEDKIEYRPVKTGAIVQPGMRVVSGNLDSSDRIVVEGLLRARPGMKGSARRALAVTQAAREGNRRRRPELRIRRNEIRVKASLSI